MFFYTREVSTKSEQDTHTQLCFDVFFCLLFVFKVSLGRRWIISPAPKPFPSSWSRWNLLGSDGVKLCHSLEEADFGGAREISSDRLWREDIFEAHFKWNFKFEGVGYFCWVSPLENALFPQTKDSDGSGGGSLPLADELTKEVWLAGWGGCWD